MFLVLHSSSSSQFESAYKVSWVGFYGQKSYYEGFDLNQTLEHSLQFLNILAGKSFHLRPHKSCRHCDIRSQFGYEVEQVPSRPLYRSLFITRKLCSLLFYCLLNKSCFFFLAVFYLSRI